MIRVFVAEDHALMREGLKLMVDGAGEMKVVGEAGSGDELLDVICHSECDVLMMDLSMPGIGGIDLIRRVQKLRHPLPILVMSMHNSPDIVTAAFNAGAKGFITKNTDAESLPAIIRKIAGGARHIDRELALNAVSSHARGGMAHDFLSDRERQIFMLIAAGHSTNRIAADLELSPKTVSTHKKNIMGKLELDSTASIVRYAISHHLIDAAELRPIR